MRRLFWLALGVTLGALIMRKLSRAAAKLTPSALAQAGLAGLGELTEALRDFGTDVRAAMGEREAQLREATGMDGTVGKVGP